MDHLSGGRVTLGVGYGWNRAEAEDHGVDFARRRAIVAEHLAAMEAIWSCDEAEFHGEFVDFGPTWSWPKPVQQPRVRTLVGGGATETVLAAAAALDGWIPIGGSGLGTRAPPPARAGRAGRPRSGRSERGPLRDHRGEGQARALREPRRDRGRAAHPGRRRALGPGRARGTRPARPVRGHTGAGMTDLIDDTTPRLGQHHAAAQDHQRGRPHRRAAPPVGHLAPGPVPRPRTQGGAPGHRGDGAHRGRHLPPDASTPTGRRPTAGSTRTSSTSTSATSPPSASTATT